MSHALLDREDLSALKYIVTHVFCPLHLPDENDHSVLNDRSLAGAIAFVAGLYYDYIPEVDAPKWRNISRMMDNLRITVQFESLDGNETNSLLSKMDVGDVHAFPIRAQNAAVMFRKQEEVTIFESFEVSPKAEDVMTTQGKLICSYPGPAIEIPNLTFGEEGFLRELVNFLVHMNNDDLDATPKSQPRDTTHPRYITELLTGVLRSIGRPADIIRISKRIGDDVVSNYTTLPWRRSPLWLLIRVALQTTLHRSGLGHGSYKAFMLFFMCCLAMEKACADLPNDLLHFMSTKISRRLRKLSSSAPDWLSRTALQTCISLRSILEKRWRQVGAAQRVSPEWAPFQLDLTRDVQLSLSSSADYIRNSIANAGVHHVDSPFNPEHRARGTLDVFLSSDGTFFDEAYRSEPYVTLYDVEQAVEGDIDKWVERVTDSDEASVKLVVLTNKYCSSATESYKNNPELLSIMLLTTLELWVALDAIAIKAFPIFADYSPEIPASLLEGLLLSRTSSLRRLRHIREYLSRRYTHCRWSVLSPALTADSFAVRFYRDSSRLQSLKDRIEKAAQHEVRRKVDELDVANTSYDELQQEAARAEHEYIVDRHGYEYHAGSCEKCALERECRDMKISVHEWPLPDDQLWAEAVVFELDCPIPFNMWRTATLHLLVDLCSPSVEKDNPRMKLTEYAALKPYLLRHPRSRFTLASSTKPFVSAHYSESSIPTTKEHICVKNGLQFYGYDVRADIIASKVLAGVSARKYCTYTLPSGSYRTLQKYVDSTSHSSNEVMANQADCHKDLSIHEYMAFGHLRSGGLLQWLNILRELRGRSLSFRCQEVHLLLAQAVSQVGPFSDSEWTWHCEIQQVPFCRALLEELEGLLQDVEGNWLEGVTMDTISFLLRRLLASSPDHSVSLKTLGLLRTVRRKVFCWIEKLSAILTKAPGDDECRGFLRDAAVICRSTFDVDPSMIHNLLHSAEDIRILICCSVLIHDHTPSKVASLSEYSQLLLNRDRRLSLVLEKTLGALVLADSSGQGIDVAVGEVWPDYRPGSRWTPLQEPNSRWFSCTTAPIAEQRSQSVHFNLHDGSLLIDGKPLGRLPDKILQHPIYNLIFGEQVLDVIPSDLQGMDYSTRAMISGHQVYFSLRGSDLVIRAKRKVSNDSELVELIPQEKFKDDLPAVLIDGHVHFLNLSTSVMEIRPLDALWVTSSENWQMCCIPGNYRMQKGDRFLVDIRSESWNMISSLLKRFESPKNLIITTSPVNKEQALLRLPLTVDLPRYSLSFYVDEDGDLQCRSVRGMIYDENQSIGTLFGLVNRLVLRPKTKSVDGINVELAPRCVLIPDGNISFKKDDYHVRVEISTHMSSLERVTYQTYRVDTDLGCLTGNVSLTSKLYCVYLHALTSGCSIDPLTGRSGIEEALSLLRSANCWSIMKLSSRDAELLTLIASICPSRKWYCHTHLVYTQQVDWVNLHEDPQHHELYVISKGIKEHYEKVRLFQDGQANPFENFKFPQHDDHLLARNVHRAAYLFPSEFSGTSVEQFDVRYRGRDLVECGSGEHHAYAVASAVHRQTVDATKKDLLRMVESWTESVSRDASKLSLRYNQSWLSPNLPLMWIKVYNLLRENDEGKWLQLLFSLPAMAYASPKLRDLVPVFVAFASHQDFHCVDPPPYDFYQISDGFRPSTDTLHDYVSDCAHPFHSSPESMKPAKPGENHKNVQKRRAKMYKERLEFDATATIDQLLSAWPCETPPPCPLNPDLYDVADFSFNARNYVSSCYRNFEFKEHLTRVQDVLNGIAPLPSSTPAPQHSYEPSQSTSSCVPWSLTFDQLFARPAPSIPTRRRFPHHTTDLGDFSNSGFSPLALHQMVAAVELSAGNSFQRQYAAALRSSAECFEKEMSISRGTTTIPLPESLVEHYVQCRDTYVRALQDVKQHLGPMDEAEEALERSGLWPRVTAQALFRSLASNARMDLSSDWKSSLTTLILLALDLQRARRLLRLHTENLQEELCKELENEGCDGWNAEANPDWLLIQLQGDFLIRRGQAEIAREMISPSSGENTAMQLNMGEGKSSVIVPTVVATLADNTQLVRVIIPKALTVQMFQILVDRLGGLANRRIYYLPFTRSLKLNEENVTVLRNLMVECMNQGGILVVQPEHVLSLKLVSVEKQLPEVGDSRVARPLLDLQKWLHSHSRDILDENDEILHVRYQLAYTIGPQQHLEGFPERWTTSEQVLRLVNKHAFALWELFPLGVEYECGPSGSFPHLRVLDPDADQKLTAWVVQDIIDGLLPNLSFGQLLSGLGDAIRSFIAFKDITQTQVRLVKDYCQGTPLWGGLLLLRGLLACGILLLVLRERRWRVDYGLAPTRTMLAVPYRAKDVPAQRAEFGHPDVAIILTCLSYYYGGLSEEQLKLSFGILLKQDDPSFDYDLWVRDCPAVPQFLRTLSGVNTKSSEQWKNYIFPLFSRNQAAVDFYLSNVVFPKEAREFPSKLACSGWDLAEKKGKVLTGFSGTNDGQYLLPLHISQCDPDYQRGTNAKVLSYILQPENEHYMCMNYNNGERRSTREILEILAAQEPPIRVLLDVGAQMLDLQNSELAAAWLTIDSNASAAIFFNEDDELTVCTRDGTTQLLLSSPFSQQLDQCVVYLDDAHTRGTNIRFPKGYRAAVTLGPKVTKDRLTQGCMRMRKLGHGHSIMFFAPLEIDQRIRSVVSKGPTDALATADILHWTIRETFSDIERWAPHWAQQGMDHTVRHNVWTNFCNRKANSDGVSDRWLQPEAKKLEDLYAPRDTANLVTSAPSDIRQRCIELGVSSLHDVAIDEEQERELTHEAERERRIERPPRVDPPDHFIHDDIVDFIKTGVIPIGTKAFRPVFETLDVTSAATAEAHIWSPYVLATEDFCKTIKSSGKLDGYLRPVQWVLSGKTVRDDDVLVILSPHEANRLIPHIRSSDRVHLHVYTPRITRSMTSCDDLALHSIPTHPTGWNPSIPLMDQLNVFAGQLYLKDYETYIRLCRFLCVYARDLKDEEGMKVECDGFIAPENRPRHLQNVDTFQNTPLDSLRTLVSLRRKGMRFALTHMGHLLDGRLLTEDDFDGCDDMPNIPTPLTSDDRPPNDLEELVVQTPSVPASPTISISDTYAVRNEEFMVCALNAPTSPVSISDNLQTCPIHSEESANQRSDVFIIQNDEGTVMISDNEWDTID